MPDIAYWQLTQRQKFPLFPDQCDAAKPEADWRYVIWCNTVEEMDFVPKATGLVPFTKLYFGNRRDGAGDKALLRRSVCHTICLRSADRSPERIIGNRPLLPTFSDNAKEAHQDRDRWGRRRALSAQDLCGWPRGARTDRKASEEEASPIKSGLES